MKKTNKALSKVLHEVINEKCIEPVKRKHGGFVEEWKRHRFPIKNGISWREAFLRDLSRPNSMWEKIIDKVSKEKNN